MNHHACRLVEHDNVVVGMDDGQGNRLGQHVVAKFRLRVELQLFAPAHPISGFGHLAIHPQVAGANPFLQPGAGKIAQQFRGDLVQAHAGLAGFHGYRPRDPIARAWHAFSRILPLSSGPSFP